MIVFYKYWETNILKLEFVIVWMYPCDLKLIAHLGYIYLCRTFGKFLCNMTDTLYTLLDIVLS